MQIVVNLLFYEVTNIFVYTLAIWCHVCRTKLYLRLTLEDRFLDVDGYGSNDTITDIAILIFSEELLYGACYVLLKSALMGTSLCSVLTIYKGVILLTILVGMCEGNFYVFTFKMNDRIHTICRHCVVEQVLKTIAREYSPAVIHYGKSCVQVGIVAKHRLHEVIVELIVFEESVVGFKEYVCTILIICFFCGI